VGITRTDSELSSDDLDSLLKDPKATVEYRIVRATRRLLVSKGLDVSMDDIATEADLGRRTVFRYFPTRDDLIARAFSESLQHFNQQVMSSVLAMQPQVAQKPQAVQCVKAKNNAVLVS